MHLSRILPATRRCAAFVILPWAFVCASATPAKLLAQAPPHGHAHEGEPEGEPFKPETPELIEATQAMQDHIKKMRDVFVRYNVSESPALDREFRDEWMELQNSGHAVYRKMMEAAAAEFSADPENRQDVARMLYDELKHNVESDQFEGMLPVANTLMEHDYEGEMLQIYAAMTAFALNEWDVCREHLEELIAEKDVTPQIKFIYDNFSLLTDNWERELAARKVDAEGEPLPQVLVRTTKGDMVLELFENQAPNSVANFISLVEKGFYENLTFLEVVEHFAAQTGCPKGDGTGGPGYTIASENDHPMARPFLRGSLAFALAGSADTAGSQFVITYLPAPTMDQQYTVFGRVIEGIEVLGNLNEATVNKEKLDALKAEKKELPPPDEIIEMRVLRKRDHPYKPVTIPLPR